MYKDTPVKRPGAWREVDVVEWAMLLAIFRVGVTALIGKVHRTVR